MSICSCSGKPRLDQVLDPLIGRDRDSTRAAAHRKAELRSSCAGLRGELQRRAADLEQHDAAGNRKIERIGAAGLRNAQQPVAGCGKVSGSPCCSLPISSRTGRPA